MNVFDMFLTVLKSFVSVFKMLLPLCIPVILLIVYIILAFIFFLLYYRVIKRKKRKPLVKRIKHHFPFIYKEKKYCLNYITEEPFAKTFKKDSIFKELLYKMPKQLAIDSLERDPNSFQEFGIHMVCGRQGAGKTICVVWLLNKWRKIYPNLEIYTNMDYKYENGSIYHWKQLIERNNGIYGIANVIDEIHTWFTSKESGKLPASVLGEISQQRKQKKCIVGTAQVFKKVASELREQTHFVYCPYTFFGVFTIVRKAYAEDYDPEKNRFKRYRGFFIFVHDKELREAYDTYKRIERYKDSDFVKNEFLGTEG